MSAYRNFIGRNIIIRTVTMTYTGKLERVYPKELVLSRAAWIADTERWEQAVKTGAFREVEVYPVGEILIGRGAIVDLALLAGPLPTSSK